jgi:4-amino-4-deoxy-L-arabinose transferase-like glycosyltransferase
VWLLSIGVTLAFLSKGLVGVVIPAGVAGLYLLIRRDFGLFLRSRPWWPLLALLLIAGPWVYAVSVRNPEFLRFFFVHEHFERFLTRVHDRYEPFWYFIPVLLVGFVPWVTLLPRIVADTWRDMREGDGTAWMLALWVLFVLAFFSLSQSKLVPYIVPAFPALALLAGRVLARIDPRRLGAHLAFMAVATLLLLAALFAVASSTQGAALLTQLNGPGRVGAIAALLLGAAGCAIGAHQARRDQRLAAIYAAAMATLLTVMVLFWASNGTDRQRNQMEAVASLQAAMKPDSEFYCVSVYVQPVVFYLERPCTLVGYKGELAFGIGQEPWHYMPDLASFAAHWRSGVDPVALVRPEVYEQLAQMRLPMRVIYTARSYVAVVRQ